MCPSISWQSNTCRCNRFNYLFPLSKGGGLINVAAAAAAKSLQSCPTLCDPIDGSPPGFAIPGILQAKTLEWVAIAFSNAWKWKVKVKSLSSVRPFATPWTAAYQAPPSSYFIPIHFVLLLLYRSRVKSHRKFSIGIKICDATHTQMWKVYCLCDVAFWAEHGLRSKGRRLAWGVYSSWGLGWGFPHAGMTLCSLIFQYSQRKKHPEFLISQPRCGAHDSLRPHGL